MAKLRCLTFSTCPSSIELDALKDEALKSTEEAQDRVHNYSGSKIFNKPKKSKNTPSASVEVKSKALENMIHIKSPRKISRLRQLHNGARTVRRKLRKESQTRRKRILVRLQQ